MRGVMVSLLFGSSFALGGCVAGMAAGALNAAARSAQSGQPPSFDPALRERAMNACRTHAASFGTPNIIDAESMPNAVMRIYGTVQDASQRRSFECSVRSDGRVSDFDLRRIPAR